MKKCETLAELRNEFKKITSGCAGDTIFMAKAAMFLCEFVVANGTHKKKRKRTEWQKFLSRRMRAGKSPREIAVEWKNR